MNTLHYPAHTRGHANHGWLTTHHTFSFASYFDPQRTHFGVLRVLNDDEVAAGRGFGSHPHDNMEIISIPLEGDLEHKDSMGNTTVIRQGDIQVMSAGTGVVHSEKNKNLDRDVKFLQIWVFPDERDVEPRYDQIAMDEEKELDAWHQVLAPRAAGVKGAVWIHQDAYFSIGRFSPGTTTTYSFNKAGHGVYLFVLEGSAEVNGHQLGRRDGFGITATERFALTAGAGGARVLAMEVPMN